MASCATSSQLAAKCYCRNIFAIPQLGTFVLHPGICPEHRNSHGCFWALANDDLRNVGMTLLRMNRGVGAGPLYAQYSYEFAQRFFLLAGEARDGETNH